MDSKAMLPISPEANHALEGVRSRLMPLVYNIDALREELMRSQEIPPSWPQIQRQAAVLSTLLESLQRVINDHDHGEALTKTLADIHPYPIPPFPSAEKAEMADALLRHKLQPEAEGFIAGRLSKASEFCDVPEDWDVQPLKKKTIDMGDREAKGNAADDEEDGGDDGVEGGAGAVKRIEGTLDEDQIAGIWDTAYDWCNEQFQNVYQDEVKSEDEEDEDEMEDVVTGGGADSAGEKGKAVSKGLDSQAQPTVPNPNTVTLGAMLKFMSTGGA